MAKFCTKCGAKLVDGKCPNCNNEQTNTITKTFDMDELITSIKGMFAHPIDTMKETIQTENITLGIILLVMNCIIIALFCCLGAKELIGAFTTGFNSFMVRTIEIPYARIFFTSLFVVFLVSFTCFGFLLSFSSFICLSSLCVLCSLFSVCVDTDVSTIGFPCALRFGGISIFYSS